MNSFKASKLVPSDQHRVMFTSKSSKALPPKILKNIKIASPISKNRTKDTEQDWELREEQQNPNHNHQESDHLRPPNIENENKLQLQSSKEGFAKKAGMLFIPKMKYISQKIRRNAHKMRQRNVNQKLMVEFQKMSSIQQSKTTGLFIKPDGVFRISWETVKFVLLVYQLMYLPFRLAFYSNTSFAAEKIVDRFFDGFLLVDMIVIFLTPVYFKYEITYSYKVIAMSYIKGWFFLDLVSILPFYEILDAITPAQDYQLAFISFLFKIFRFIRFVKLFRLVRSVDSKGNDNYIFRLVDYTFHGTAFYVFLPNLCLNIIFMHLIACLWYALGDANEDNTGWITVNKSQNRSLFDKYIISLYFVVQTFTTTGYGDIYSKANIEIATRILMMCFSILLYGLFSGQVINFNIARMEREELLELKLQKLEEMKQQFKLDEVLYQNLIERFKEGKSEKKARQHDFSSLSLSEKDQLDYHKFLLKFHSIPIFTDNIDFVRFQINLGRLMMKKFYRKDQIIYYKGEASVLFYMIGTGTVGVMMDDIDEVPCMLIKKGYFGENEILYSGSRKHTMRAMTDCLIYYVDSIQFKKLISEDPMFYSDFQRLSFQREVKILNAYIAVSEYLRRKVFWKLIFKNSKNRQRRTFERLVKSEKYHKKKSFSETICTCFWKSKDKANVKRVKNSSEPYFFAETTDKFEE